MAAHFFRVNEWVLRYSHTIGQGGYGGPGFYQPTDLTRSEVLEAYIQAVKAAVGPPRRPAMTVSHLAV